jgi:hypothetical protein
MFWHANEVAWNGAETQPHKELLGRTGKNRPALKLANFWDQRGIYILYNDYGPYYVGRTMGDGMNLGKRLSHHYFGTNGSPHAGRWNRFSWFGWRGTLTTSDHRGLQQLRKVPKRLLTSSTDTVQDIESLLIFALGTIHVGNAKEENFKGAVRWQQVPLHERDYYLSKAAR